MHNSKLTILLRSLSKVEINRFMEMVESPYFNKNDQVLQLSRIYYDTFPNYSKKKLDREKVFERLYPNQAYDEQQLRYVMSDLTKLAERFLILENLEKKSIQKHHLLFEELGERQLDKFRSTVIDHSRKVLSKNKKKDAAYYFNHFMISLEDYELVSQKREVDVEGNLRELITDLDRYYILQKLKYSCELVNRTNILAGDYDPLLLEEILNYLEKNKHEHIPAIAIYFRILMTMIDSDNQTHYRKLRELLNQSTNLFSREERYDLYIYARNYCIKQVNQGAGEYLPELFDLYLKLLEEGIIFQNGVLSQWDYKNLVAIALRLKKFEWAVDFIYDYKEYLRPENQINAYTYNLALLYYHQGKYGKTMELLQEVEFTDVFYNLNCKALLMQTYYELEETDALYSLMDSFYAYLRRNKKISAYKMDSYLNFISFVKRLNKARYQDTKGLENLKKQIRATEFIQNTSWLLSKIDEMEEKRPAHK